MLEEHKNYEKFSTDSQEYWTGWGMNFGCGLVLFGLVLIFIGAILVWLGVIPS